MTDGRPILYYVADPMCSWCHGFTKELARVEEQLPAEVLLRLVTGGLAPDSDEPMDPATRGYVQDAWRAVAAATGAEFNLAFWERCAPRRSTYPACRAVHAAESLQPGAGREMLAAIQRAYYAEARNPSDRDVLTALASELAPPLNPAAFERELASDEVAARFEDDLELKRRLDVHGFPSLVLAHQGVQIQISRGFERADSILLRLRAALNA